MTTTDPTDLAAMLTHALEIDFEMMSSGCAICELIAEHLGVEVGDPDPRHNEPNAEEATYNEPSTGGG